MKNTFIIIISIMLSACSTLINGTNQTVTIDNYYNENEAVKVYTPHSDYVDTMPARLHISGGVQGGEYSVQMKNECYDQQRLHINKTLRSSYWLNLFNVVGFFVDYSTGAMWEYPSKMHMPMSRDEACFSSLATQ